MYFILDPFKNELEHLRNEWNPVQAGFQVFNYDLFRSKVDGRQRLASGLITHF